MDSPARVEKDPVPDKIVSAERWRVAGEKLRDVSPEMFEKVFMMLATSIVSISDDDPPPITESYFPT